MGHDQAATLNPAIRILVVDDSASMRRIVLAALSELGFKNFLEAEGGEQAWDILDKGGVELVLCDHNMPGLTGTELLGRLRADERFQALPFIMITAEANRENVVAAVRMGVSNYLVKPFSSSVLAKKIAATLDLELPPAPDDSTENLKV